MEDKKIQELVIKLEKFRIELSKSEKKSKDFLVDVGLVTPNGNLTKNYKHLCTLPESA